MHGVGIRAMGRLMDKVMGSLNPANGDATLHAQAAMEVVRPHCRWTAGEWEDLSLRWNDLENTGRNQRLLSNLLIRVYFNAGQT